MKKNCHLHVMNMTGREKHIKPRSCPAIIFLLVRVMSTQAVMEM